MSHPQLSVIVPVHNSSIELRQCLAALAASTYPDFEVIVVDDGSTEPIEPLVTHHKFGYLRVNGPKGPAYARNRGAEAAAGEWLVFVDADVCVHPDTLVRIARTFSAHPELAGVIGCYDEEPAEQNFTSQYKNLFHHYVHRIADGNICTFWSGCGAIPRELFLEYDGFDERRYRRPSIEDIELGARMAKAGHTIVLDSLIRVKHLKRWGFWGLLKSDVLDRGIPWVGLMLRLHAAPDILNVTWQQRISVVLVYMSAVGLAAALLWRQSIIVAAVAAAGVTLLNLDFYKFFVARKGVWFALRAIPLHWLYFIYCGLALVAGVVVWLAERLRAPDASQPREPVARP